MDMPQNQDAIESVKRQKRLKNLLTTAFYRLSILFLVSVIFACVAFQFRKPATTILIDRKGQVYEPRLVSGDEVNAK